MMNISEQGVSCPASLVFHDSSRAVRCREEFFCYGLQVAGRRDAGTGIGVGWYPRARSRDFALVTCKRERASAI